MSRKNTVHLVSADGLPLCDDDLDPSSVQCSNDADHEGRVCRRCQKKMEKELAALARLRELDIVAKGFPSINLDGPDKYAKFVFAVVPHGWQADVEVRDENRLMTKGSICRDWGSTGPEARRFGAKLLEMAKTGKP